MVSGMVNDLTNKKNEQKELKILLDLKKRKKKMEYSGQILKLQYKE